MTEEFDNSPLGLMNQIRKGFKARARRLARKIQSDSIEVLDVNERSYFRIFEFNATYGSKSYHTAKMYWTMKNRTKTPTSTGVILFSLKRDQVLAMHHIKLEIF